VGLAVNAHFLIKIPQGKIKKEFVSPAFSTMVTIVQIKIDPKNLDYCGKVTFDLKQCDGSPPPSFITLDTTPRSYLEDRITKRYITYDTTEEDTIGPVLCLEIHLNLQDH